MTLLDDILKIVKDAQPLPSFSDHNAVKMTVMKISGDIVDLVYNQIPVPVASCCCAENHAMLTKALVEKATTLKATTDVGAHPWLDWIIANAPSIISMVVSILGGLTPKA